MLLNGHLNHNQQLWNGDGDDDYDKHGCYQTNRPMRVWTSELVFATDCRRERYCTNGNLYRAMASRNLMVRLSLSPPSLL